MNIVTYRPIYDLSEMDYPIEYDWENLPRELVVKVVMFQQFTVVGFVSYKFASQQTVEIQKLAVKERMRRLKFGTETIHYLIQRARETGTKTLRMTVPLSNTVGCYFLASCGFTGELRNGQFVQFERNVIL